MKNIFYYLTVILLMVASVSCDLDKYPYDAIEQSQAFKTLMQEPSGMVCTAT